GSSRARKRPAETPHDQIPRSRLDPGATSRPTRPAEPETANPSHIPTHIPGECYYGTWRARSRPRRARTWTLPPPGLLPAEVAYFANGAVRARGVPGVVSDRLLDAGEVAELLN